MRSLRWPETCESPELFKNASNMVLDQLRVCVFQCLTEREEGRRRMCEYVCFCGGRGVVGGGDLNEINAVAFDRELILSWRC